VGLQVYRKKRDFSVTAEPRGGTQRREGGRYVIQKHDASRLHYDLRLELDGVMKSWAVTRGPSLVPGEKRLAIHVEDHPVEYNSFEGTIPKGQYGGGTVMIWDRGHWAPEGDPHQSYKKGRLDFVLDGEKLKGRWHLVRMRKRANERQDPWLLIKSDDEAARSARDEDVLEEEPLSVASGRSMEEIAQGRGGKRVWQSNRGGAGKAAKTSGNKTSRNKASGNKTTGKQAAEPAKRDTAAHQGATRAPRRAASSAKKRKSSRKSKSTRKGKAKAKSRGDALPDFVPPALATLRAAAPAGAGWRHEVKFDGYRVQARLDHGEVRLLTRKGLDWAAKFAEIATAVGKLPAETALLDGELVVEEATGVSSFSALQGDLKAGRRDRFVYYVFDLLHLDGADLMALPLTQRQATLAGLLRRAKPPGAIRLSEPFDDDGTLVLQQACRMKLEGIVSKRADAPYVSGRSESWIKAKCANRQELVVVGYAPSSVMRNAIGALVVGYYDDGELRYGGRVGTGYSQAMAKELWRRLQPLKAERPPIDPPPPQERLRRDVVWVAPRMVIEANFRDWTADRLVRQAAFKGIREDKPAKEVARETPVMPAKAKLAKKTSKRPAPRKSAAADDVHLTHPDRVYWVDVGVTKQDLADYYRAVWDWMAPQVVGRPLALVRCPEGTKGQCFFQKHASAGLSEKSLRTVIDAKGRQIIAVDDLDGLISLVQAGVLEIHVRGAMIDRLDACDRIVFDLDPGEGVAWPAMVAAAREVRERLSALKLESFVKLSGGKGLHVVLPIDGADWESAKTFAQAVALTMAADAPDRYLAKITKSLRKGKIFVDYLRNSLEQTSVAAYSTRARAGAPVSVPVAWPELGRTTSASQYTVLDLTKRLGRLKQDPWADIARVRQGLPEAAQIRSHSA
jgi:bifunctional non-homologous end joining protein LigD